MLSVTRVYIWWKKRGNRINRHSFRATRLGLCDVWNIEAHCRSRAIVVHGFAAAVADDAHNRASATACPGRIYNLVESGADFVGLNHRYEFVRGRFSCSRRGGGRPVFGSCSCFRSRSSTGQTSSSNMGRRDADRPAARGPRQPPSCRPIRSPTTYQRSADARQTAGAPAHAASPSVERTARIASRLLSVT